MSVISKNRSLITIPVIKIKCIFISEVKIPFARSDFPDSPDYCICPLQNNEL